VSTPTLLAVWTDLAEALRGIRSDGGYTHTVEPDAVVTEPVMALTVARSPFLVVGPTEGTSRQFLASMRVRENPLLFAIEGYLDVDGLDPMRKAEAMSTLAADIERALTRDLTRGGHAVRTLVRAPEFGMGFGAQSRVYVGVLVAVDLIRQYGAS